MNQSLRPAVALPGAGPWWETRASLAFVERNLYLVKRYWHLELAFLIFNVASAMSVLYIGEAQMQAGGNASGPGRVDLVLYLGIGRSSGPTCAPSSPTWGRWSPGSAGKGRSSTR
jgi:hypothetical protein